MISLVCILSLVASYAYAETCDIQSLQQCIHDNLGLPAKEKGKGDQMKSQFEGCFTSAGCKIPQPKGKDSGNFQAVQTCRKNILDKVKSDVEKCVQKSNPNFKFPPMPQGGEHGGFNGPPPPMGDAKGKGGFLDKVVNDSCPTDQAKSKAKTCLQALVPQGTRPPKPVGGSSSEMKQKFCQAKTACFAKISPTCQKSFNDTKDALCKCAKDIVTPQVSQLQTSLKACNPNEGRFTRPPGAPTKGPENPADRFIKKFCDSKC